MARDTAAALVSSSRPKDRQTESFRRTSKRKCLCCERSRWSSISRSMSLHDEAERLELSFPRGSKSELHGSLAILN